MKLSFITSHIATACLALREVAPAFHTGGALTPRAHQLVRRFDSLILASDPDWKAARCRGGKLVDLMLMSDEEAGPKIEDTKGNQPPSGRSEFQGDLKQELKTWGWHDFPTTGMVADLDSWHVNSVVKALGINGESKSDGGNNIPYDVEHWDPDLKDERGVPINKKDQTYKVDGREYRATQARHSFIVNPIDGLIIGHFLESPASAAARAWYRKPANEELPKLKKLSDIFWGYWARENQNLKNIHYFWMIDIANEKTEEILARALHEANKQIEPWPGTTFDIKSDAGKAILGSPNGAVFAWFLIQHKAQLGDKWISKVTVFLDDLNRDSAGAHLIFYVENAPEYNMDDEYCSQSSLNPSTRHLLGRISNRLAGEGIAFLYRGPYDTA